MVYFTKHLPQWRCRLRVRLLKISPATISHNFTIHLKCVQHLPPIPGSIYITMKALFVFRSLLWCRSFPSIVDKATEEVFPKSLFSEVLLSSDGIIDVSNHWNSTVRPPEKSEAGLFSCLLVQGGFPLSHATWGEVLFKEWSCFTPFLFTCLDGKPLTDVSCCSVSGGSFLLQQEFCCCRTKPAGDQEIGF